jgi:hypothetical protein
MPVNIFKSLAKVKPLYVPAYRVYGGTAPLLLNLDLRYMLLISLTLRSHFRKRVPRTLSLGTSRSGVFGDEINLLCRRDQTTILWTPSARPNHYTV